LRIKDPRKSSTYPRVCLRFSRTLMHQDLSTSLRKKSLNLGHNNFITVYLLLFPVNTVSWAVLDSFFHIVLRVVRQLGYHHKTRVGDPENRRCHFFAYPTKGTFTEFYYRYFHVNVFICFRYLRGQGVFSIQQLHE